jgi:Domain of unknown function (DUF6456)
MSLSGHEVEREARRIFRKLASGAFYLAPRDGENFALCLRGRTTSMLVSAAMVREWLKRGWLAAREGARESFVLSDAGEGWFVRIQTISQPFAAQHQLRRRRLMATPHGEEIVIVNEGESTLGWLKKRGIVDSVQCDAGERLRRDFTLAQLAPRLGVDLSAPVVLGMRGAKSASISDMALAAKQRFSAAMKSVGPGLSDLLFDICCHLIGLEDAERTKGWPRRSGKVVLRIALDRLAMHYGMRAPARAKVRVWRDEG